LIWIKDGGAISGQLPGFALRRPGMNAIGKAISAALCAGAFLLVAILCGWSQDAERGRTEYLENCAGCHGADAKGVGPRSTELKMKLTDLTLLAQRNHGIFDSAAVYQMIDGRNARATHRNAQMPIWGCRHVAPALPPPPAAAKHRKLPKRIVTAMKPHEDELDALLDLPCGSEDAVRERILSIVEYLKGLQAK
jgi:mono/diheme cytochrome c family protein